MSNWGRRFIVDRPFDQALSGVIEALRAERFAVTVLDVQRMVREELHGDFRRYALLTANAPALLARAIRIDLDSGVLMPCQVAVYELPDGRTIVDAADPMPDLTYSTGCRQECPDLAQVASDLAEQLGRALARVSKSVPAGVAA